jgi:hypothetical protein
MFSLWNLKVRSEIQNTGCHTSQIVSAGEDGATIGRKEVISLQSVTYLQQKVKMRDQKQ